MLALLLLPLLRKNKEPNEAPTVPNPITIIWPPNEQLTYTANNGGDIIIKTGAGTGTMDNNNGFINLKTTNTSDTFTVNTVIPIINWVSSWWDK